MQLMSPLQISDPFGSFPHSPTMDNYPKLEEMMLLSNGAPQFLGAAGAPEGSSGSSSSSSGGGGGGGGGGSSSSSNSSSAFNPQGEASEQPYEHLTAGKLWPTPRASPFADILASSPSPRPSQRPLRCRDANGVSLPFLSSPGSCVRGLPGDILPTPTLSLTVRRGASFCFGWRAVGLRGWMEEGELVLTSRAAPPPPPERLA